MEDPKCKVCGKRHSPRVSCRFDDTPAVPVEKPAVRVGGCESCAELMKRIRELDAELRGKKAARAEYMQRYRAMKKVPVEKE